MGKGNERRFSREFKLTALARMAAGEKVSALAETTASTSRFQWAGPDPMSRLTIEVPYKEGRFARRCDGLDISRPTGKARPHIARARDKDVARRSAPQHGSLESSYVGPTFPRTASAPSVSGSAE
jgi:hypothetical protein